MRSVTLQARRRLLVRRHHLGGTADGPEAVTGALVALHASDPASVYLSVLTRSTATTVRDVAAALYERRSLVRWMAMRRTLFVFNRDDIPMIQAAVSTPLAASLRTRLVNQLRRNGTQPPLDEEPDDWVDTTSVLVEDALGRRSSATGSQLAGDEPRLAVSILARTASQRPQNVTTSLLTLMSAQGRIVRGRPTGAWTSRHHAWEPVAAWWPDGLPERDGAEAAQTLASRWLARFGPATPEDLRWWTGWSKGVTRRALTGLALEEVDLHGGPGIVLAHDLDASEPADDESAAPGAALLPALDPTPMGWTRRDWMFGIDPALVFDSAGNIGPTVWWDGEIVGSWAVTAAGDLCTAVLADRGSDAAKAIADAAAHLHHRLSGAVVVPAARTPLEQSILADASRAPCHENADDIPPPRDRTLPR